MVKQADLPFCLRHLTDQERLLFAYLRKTDPLEVLPLTRSLMTPRLPES